MNYCAVITGPTWPEIQAQIQAALPHADLLEYRWDLFDSLDYPFIRHLPTIFTLRAASQGGRFEGREPERLSALQRLLRHLPDYVDLEHSIPQTFDTQTIKVIRSYHDFEKTPQDLDAILTKMPPADVYKIAVMAHSTADSLRMLDFQRRMPKNVLAFCMGECGVITRAANTLWSYCSVGTRSAPGQLPLQAKVLYALIGDPITGSISDITHNALLAHFKSDAHYLKISVKPEELEGFLTHIRSSPFRGLSVTMPLKEVILPYLDEIDPKARSIGAVNTVRIQKGKLYGTNTDGSGALQAIQAKMDVEGKTVLIVGAGGAARALVYELMCKKARVCIYNRTPARAEALAKEFGCEAHLPDTYDLLVNCTPSGMPLAPDLIQDGCYVFEMKTRPKMTPLMQEAERRGCGLIFGYELFVNQACGQFDLWFDGALGKQELFSVLKNEVEKIDL